MIVLVALALAFPVIAFVALVKALELGSLLQRLDLTVSIPGARRAPAAVARAESLQATRRYPPLIYGSPGNPKVPLVAGSLKHLRIAGVKSPF